jgi:hypothetical protein
MTNTEYLRWRLLADVHDVVNGDWCISFSKKRDEELFGVALPFLISHAKPRLLMGAFKYDNTDGISHAERARQGLSPTFISKLKEKIELYEQDGNQEYLVDAFNYLLLKTADPVHPKAHFASTEREEIK